jgi:hypothetical protein
MRITNFEDLTQALSRFEQLFGVRDGTREACEFQKLSCALRSFEDQLAEQIATQTPTAWTVRTPRGKLSSVRGSVMDEERRSIDEPVNS